MDLTCPEEGQKHKVNDYHIDLFAELIEVESLREKLRKRNESKLLQLYQVAPDNSDKDNSNSLAGRSIINVCS